MKRILVSRPGSQNAATAGSDAVFDTPVMMRGALLQKCSGARPKAALIAMLTLAVLATLCSCDRKKRAPSRKPDKVTSLATALPYSSGILPARSDRYFVALHQVQLRAEPEKITFSATGDDPNATLHIGTTRGSRVALYIDVESSIETSLELFYQVGANPFSTAHVFRSTLAIGQNRLLFDLSNPEFTGAIRLDIGHQAGEYILNDIRAFSTEPVEFIARRRSQAELAAAFAASEAADAAAAADPLLLIKTPVEQDRIKPLQDVELKPGLDGLQMLATGIDPSVLLPQFEMRQPAIIKIVLVSPVATTLQVFYKLRGQIDFDEAHSYSEPLIAGENVIFFEHTEPGADGIIRLDPGASPGTYVMKHFEFRADAEGVSRGATAE